MPLHVKFQSVNFNFNFGNQVSVEPRRGSHVLLLMFLNETIKKFYEKNELCLNFVF